MDDVWTLNERDKRNHYEPHCILCSLQKDAEGLEFQLYLCDCKRIFDNNISKEAWGQWQSKQTMLINEKKQHDGSWTS